MSAAAAEQLCAAWRREHPVSLFLDGRGTFPSDGWGAPLVAFRPRVALLGGPGSEDALNTLDRLVARRRGNTGSGTGVLALLGYGLLDPTDRSRALAGMPDILLIAVDASVRFGPGGLEVYGDRGIDPRRSPAFRRWSRSGETAGAPAGAPAPLDAPRTSLPRAAYLAGVERVREHIRAGDVYQVNLCQQFRCRPRVEPFEAYRALVADTPAPYSSYLEIPGLALASASPEMFLEVDADGSVETRPIKGTRPRGTTPEEDRRQARELLDSAKDRAELTMIVDLERNDLGRVCRIGSIEVPERAGLESYSAVHHLVARVRGRLEPGTRPSDLLRATFPGGSITGAPKRRTLEVIRGLEPVERNFFTGSLCWFGDDGSMRSSILIRSIVFDRHAAYVGAGGGVVLDSDPEAEWRESNHKARALTRALGFAPEEAD
ncbi:hypothetical protein ABI59_01780 [Acidobacteria bacterium Mor1]|nr:hypothetical protein ABI59_01780 [Acidobacteria bacterium Mor1]